MCCCLQSYYDIGEDMLKSIAKHVVCNEITPRVHGNSGRRSPNAFEFDEYKSVKTFRTTYADDYGHPQPAAARRRDEDPPIYLPASHSKKHVYQVYKEALHEKFVGTSVFYMICGKNYVLTSKLAPRKMMFALSANYIEKSRRCKIRRGEN